MALPFRIPQPRTDLPWVTSDGRLALPVAQYMPQLDALVRQMASAQTGALTGGGGVTSLNSLVGALNITAGANITVTLSGSNIQIASTGAAGGGLTIGTTP